MCEKLLKYGEKVNPKWKLLVSEPVEFDAEGNEILTRTAIELNLASAGSYGENKSGVTNTDSSQDNNGYLVRYKYGNRPSNDSRDFCREMTSLASTGIVYTKESIEKMGKDGVNGKWSKKGSSTYSIWFYKGGGGCRHLWFRQVYSGETGAQTSREKARRDGYEQPTNNPKVPTPPCTMPNAGFVTKDGSGYKC